MSRTKIAAIIAAHSCRVEGVVYRFQLELFATEPKWSGARCLHGVRANSHKQDNETLLNVLVRGAATPAEVLSLLHDALAESMAERRPVILPVPPAACIDAGCGAVVGRVAETHVTVLDFAPLIRS